MVIRIGGFMTATIQDRKDIKKKEETVTISRAEYEELKKAEVIARCHRIFDKLDDVNRSLSNR